MKMHLFKTVEGCVAGEKMNIYSRNLHFFLDLAAHTTAYIYTV